MEKKKVTTIRKKRTTVKKTKGVKSKMSEEEKKELLIKQEQEKNLLIKQEVDDWGMGEAVPMDAIEIPRILLCQGSSDAVLEGDASVGYIIDSMTREKLGSAIEREYKEVDIVPLTFSMSWRHMKFDGTQYKFHSNSIYNRDNASLPWEEIKLNPETKQEERWRNDQCLNFFVLLKDKIDDILATPYMVTFARTSFKAGKKLSSHFAKCQRAASLGHFIPPALQTFKLGGKLEKGDHNFYVFRIIPGEKTSDKHLQIAKSWIPQLASSNIKVDEEEFYQEKKEAEIPF